MDLNDHICDDVCEDDCYQQRYQRSLLPTIHKAEERRQGIKNYFVNSSFNWSLQNSKCPTDLSRLTIIREQKRQVSKVLLNGLYDPNCLLSMLRGVRTEVIGEIVWKEMLAWNWKIFPEEKTVGSARATSDFSLSHELLDLAL